MKRLVLLLCGALLSLSLAAPTAADSFPYFEQRGDFTAAPSRVIVEFHGTPSARAVGGIRSAGHDLLFARFREDLRTERLQTQSTEGQRAVILREFRAALLGAVVEADDATVSRIRTLPYVLAIHPDREVRLAPLDLQPASVAVDARTSVNAQSLPTDGTGIVVAILDTGIDYTHPALGGGYGAGFKVIGGYDFVNDDDDPMDDHGHGTHVAGTVAANAPDLLGVAPGASLVAYKVLSVSGSGSTSGILAAIERSVDPNGDGDPSDRIDVINLSLGGPGDAEDVLSRAVDNAVSAGVIAVVAAGNNGETATISSPGTAAQAITVAAIDSEGMVALFSSRGPSPRLLGFKPDVSAPGSQIVSTRVGGGSIAASGTSMAAPHVAGVAALLRKLHPDWTPAEVKTSITSSAAEVEDLPFARGAGRVDARAAHEAKVLADVSGISFGIRPSRSGTTTESRTFRLTNRSATAQSLSIALSRPIAGVNVRVNPTSLQIPPGASAEVSVELQTANETLEFPRNYVLGGDLLISGTSSLRVPWGILRTARARINFDGEGLVVIALGAEETRGAFFRDPHNAELYLRSGASWDFLLVGSDAGQKTSHRVVVRPDVVIDGDHLFDVRLDEASLEVVVDGRDETGRRLIERSSGRPETSHLVGSRLFWQVGTRRYSVFNLNTRAQNERLFFSPLPPRFSLYHLEQFADAARQESYTIEHPVLAGLEESTRLEGGGAELISTRLEWASLPGRQLSVCSFDRLTFGINLSYETCFARLGPAAVSSLHWTTSRRTVDAGAGMTFHYGGVATQALMGHEGETVVSSELTPPLTAERIAAGGTAIVAAGPTFPFAFPGTHNQLWLWFPRPGFIGAAGELIAERNGTAWTRYDEAGRVLASGIWRGFAFDDGFGAVEPRSRFVAVREDIESAGRFTRGTLEVTAGSDPEDLTAPTLTSLRVVDATGRNVSRLRVGEQAALRFSVADLDYQRNGLAQTTRPEATRAWFRVSGTEVWVPLAVVVSGSESGTIPQLGHVPAGDLYSADLTAATAVNHRLIDLRLEFSDARGNQVRWTHEGAIAVGTPATSPKRRSAR